MKFSFLTIQSFITSVYYVFDITFLFIIFRKSEKLQYDNLRFQEYFQQMKTIYSKMHFQSQFSKPFSERLYYNVDNRSYFHPAREEKELQMIISSMTTMYAKRRETASPTGALAGHGPQTSGDPFRPYGKPGTELKKRPPTGGLFCLSVQ